MVKLYLRIYREHYASLRLLTNHALVMEASTTWHKLAGVCGQAPAGKLINTAFHYNNNNNIIMELCHVIIFTSSYRSNVFL